VGFGGLEEVEGQEGQVLEGEGGEDLAEGVVKGGSGALLGKGYSGPPRPQDNTAKIRKIIDRCGKRNGDHDTAISRVELFFSNFIVVSKVDICNSPDPNVAGFPPLFPFTFSSIITL